MNENEVPLYGELVSFPHVENQNGIPDEERIMEDQTRVMIEEAAYFLAQKRGFSPGYELQDWLQAEAQIKNNIHTPI
jgi:hypothetical protein